MSQDRQPTHPRRADAEIAALVLELKELARSAPARLSERLAGLRVREQAELALRLSAADRLELMLHAPKPMALVRALPDFELYLTVRELGPGDALPLLALASAEQITHLLDLESWRQDRFDAQRAGAWVALLFEAGEPTARRFLRLADDDLLALLFQRWVQVRHVEFEGDIELHSVHAPESGDERGQRSPDGAYHFVPLIAEHATVVRQLARMLFVEQRERYQRTLWAAIYELPAELEENALRWRQSRLEEHGFPPPDEALGVYAPPAGLRVHPSPPEPIDEEALAVPRAPLRVLARENRLAVALAGLDPAHRERTLHELIGVANRLMIADGADTGDPRAHAAKLLDAAGQLDIALQARAGDDPAAIARTIEEAPLIELFREGYARAVDLALTVRRQAMDGWAASHPRAYELLDSPVRERWLALRGARPLYVEVDDRGVMSERPFRSSSEIDETRAALELAEVVGDLLVGRLGLDPTAALAEAARGATPEPSFSTWMLTLLAWHAARGELRADPLGADVAADFLRDVGSRRTAGPDAPERALAALVERLVSTFGLEPRQAVLLRAYGRACLERLQAECGGLDPSLPIDPRSVSCLRLHSAPRT